MEAKRSASVCFAGIYKLSKSLADCCHPPRSSSAPVIHRLWCQCQGDRWNVWLKQHCWGGGSCRDNLGGFLRTREDLNLDSPLPRWKPSIVKGPRMGSWELAAEPALPKQWASCLMRDLVSRKLSREWYSKASNVFLYMLHGEGGYVHAHPHPTPHTFVHTCIRPTHRDTCMHAHSHTHKVK